MNRILSQDDFIPEYMNVANASNESYPKIILWSLSMPITLQHMQISATILQRKMRENDYWHFIPSLKVSDPSLSTNNDNPYATDRYSNDSTLLLPREDSFNNAVAAIMKTINQLERKYF